MFSIKSVYSHSIGRSCRLGIVTKISLGLAASLIDSSTFDLGLHQASATPGSTISITAPLQHTQSSKSSILGGNQDAEVLSALLTHHHGFTPWGDALLMSDRYLPALRRHSLDQIKEL